MPILAGAKPEEAGDTKGLTVKVSGLSKRFQTEQGVVNAAEGVSFSVQPGTFFTLLGPSGCGKSTTLRCVAGLERPDSGEIIAGDRLLFSSQKEKAPCGAICVGLSRDPAGITNIY